MAGRGGASRAGRGPLTAARGVSPTPPLPETGTPPRTRCPALPGAGRYDRCRRAEPDAGPRSVGAAPAAPGGRPRPPRRSAARDQPGLRPSPATRPCGGKPVQPLSQGEAQRGPRAGGRGPGRPSTGDARSYGPGFRATAGQRNGTPRPGANTSGPGGEAPAVSPRGPGRSPGFGKGRDRGTLPRSGQPEQRPAGGQHLRAPGEARPQAPRIREGAGWGKRTAQRATAHAVSSPSPPHASPPATAPPPPTLPAPPTSAHAPAPPPSAGSASRPGPRGAP